MESVCHLGGYYMDFPTTRALMKFYEIPDKGVEDDRLDYPLNDWLAKNKKRNVLAGTIMHPAKDSDIEDGMLLITQQVWYDEITTSMVNSLPPLPERDIDVRAKQWLLDAGATVDKLEWLSIWDEFGLTNYGRVPFKNNVKGRRPMTLDFTEVPDEAYELYKKWKAQGRPDARAFFGDEWYEAMTKNNR